MDKEKIIDILSDKLRLVRTEYDFSQEKMALVLGLSKKTLIQIEKGRNKLGWAYAVALCAIFRESEILQMTLGGNPVETMETIALKDWGGPKNNTLGGKVWWDNLQEKGGFRLQKNVISGHYRILDNKNRRWYSSLNKDYIDEKFYYLSEENDK
ncbi:helix-turn-helix transcriptional regulator [Desulfitibacter alkalitolerans]|uniref:helix-turn-helix transcriptional regulator n=1 Tax=Desulfitibacter alkalitolerans TaxID=264641 RepID=UPI00047F5F68|nr:helix-turn-helix domain-containing protein [Desulfitibacter alkalitolerans]